MAYVCPHCGKNPEIPLGMENNCQRYFSKPIVRTHCCGRGVRLVPNFHITIEPAPPGTKADSLGVALNRDDA